MLRPILVAGVVLCTAPASAQTIINFDGDRGLDDRQINSPYHPVEFKDGVSGQALDFDGYSTSVTGAIAPPAVPFSLSAIAAPRSFSPNTAGLVHLTGSRTLQLGLNRWGYPSLHISAPGTDDIQLTSRQPMALHSWNSVEAVVNQDEVRLVLNGEVMARLAHTLEPGYAFGGEVLLGQNPGAAVIDGTYPTGHFNGLIDDVVIGAVDHSVDLATSDPDLAIATSRFADDPNRPEFHPMPPAGWTNEPHAFFKSGDEWHLYYQANPNGPWWDLMQWGHMASDDLLTWEARPQALWPTPGFDSQGIWVGDTFEGPEGVVTTLYTGVNGQRAGVGLAQDNGAGLQKSPRNPVIAQTPQGYQDMRDPFLIRQDDGWLMLIGSGTLDRERPEILTFRSDDLIDWSFAGPLETGPIERFGVYWELPKLFPVGDDLWALFVTTVKPDTPARTQYWLGQWDGTRFTPQDPRPQLLDLFRTHLAHTFARFDETYHVATGVVPEENRTGEERLDAGWIHGFGLPRLVALCDDGRRLCQQPVPDVENLFEGHAQSEATIGTDWHTVARELEHGRIQLSLDPASSEPVQIALRATPERDEATVLTWYPEDQRLSLDFSGSSLTPHSRSDTLWASLPAETRTFDIFIDGSFVTLFTETGGSAAFRVFPTSEAANTVQVSMVNEPAADDREIAVEVWR